MRTLPRPGSHQADWRASTGRCPSSTRRHRVLVDRRGANPSQRVSRVTELVAMHARCILITATLQKPQSTI